MGAGPGGAYDIYSRGVSNFWSKTIKAEFIVKNTPGAGGQTGMMTVYRAKPDGYTIGMVDTEKRVAESLVSKMDYDINQVKWVGAVAQSTAILCVKGDSPWNTIDDIRKAGLTTPIRVACQDVGPVEAVSMPILNINAKYISGYAGSADAILGIIKGDADICVYSDTSVLSFIQGKDLKPIAVFGSKPNAVMEANGIKVPVAPAEYADLGGLLGCRAFAAPPGTPDNIMAALEKSLMDTLKDPAMLAWAKTANSPITALTSKQLMDEFTKAKTVYAKYVDILKKYM